MSESKFSYPILSLLSLDGKKFAELAKRMLDDTDKADLTAQEIVTMIVTRKFGSEWYKMEKGATRTVKRAGLKLAQLLGTKPHAKETRDDLGIGIHRKKSSDKFMRPLRFYLIGADFVKLKPEKPKREIASAYGHENP